jgi:hypothetical protein
MSPSQKYGIVLKNVVTGMIASSLLPRFQPTIAPATVPIVNEMIVAMPTRPSVHGRAGGEHLGDRAQAVQRRDAEVAAQQHPPVLDVLLPDRLVGVDAEQDAQRLLGLGAHAAVAREVRADRVALHEARQEEVDRDGRPQREQVEALRVRRRSATGPAGSALGGGRGRADLEGVALRRGRCRRAGGTRCSQCTSVRCCLCEELVRVGGGCDRSSRVYGSCGLRMTSSAAPYSTTRPWLSTMISSLKWRAVARSWVM